jgi:hypothetical protein
MDSVRGASPARRLSAIEYSPIPRQMCDATVGPFDYWYSSERLEADSTQTNRSCSNGDWLGMGQTS